MLALDPQYHHVRQHGISEWLRREFPGQPLFLMLNTFQNPPVWEICEWIGGDHCHEYHIIGPNLGAFDRTQAATLRGLMRQRQEGTKALRQALLEAGRSRDALARDRDDRERDFYRWYRRRTGSGSPVLKAMAGELGN